MGSMAVQAAVSDDEKELGRGLLDQNNRRGKPHCAGDENRARDGPATTAYSTLADEVLVGVNLTLKESFTPMDARLHKMQKEIDLLSPMSTRIKSIDTRSERAEVDHKSLKYQVSAISRDQKTSEIIGVVLSLVLGAILIWDEDPSVEVQNWLLYGTGTLSVVIFATVIFVDLKWPIAVYEFAVYRTVRATHIHIQVVVATFAGFWTKERDFGILLLGVAGCQIILMAASLAAAARLCGAKTEIEAVFKSVLTPNDQGHVKLFFNFLAKAAKLARLNELSDPTVAELTDMLERARAQLFAQVSTMSAEQRADWHKYEGNETWDHSKTIKVMEVAFKFLKTGKKEENS